MQRTSNYQLPQWEKEDRILMEDFNDAMSRIDAAIQAARDAADAAQSTALSHKNYVSGTYGGTGTQQKITLGFRPSAVLITKFFGTNGYEHGTDSPLFLDGKTYSAITFEDDGFSLERQDSDHQPYPNVNINVNSYSYIAFH